LPLTLLAGIAALIWGAALASAGMNVSYTLSSVVRTPRPRLFVALHNSAIWTSGMVALLAGLAMAIDGAKLIGQGL